MLSTGIIVFSTPYTQEIDAIGDEMWTNMWISKKT
jgi:hypothetical protein